jgi:hypothetical protein
MGALPQVALAEPGEDHRGDDQDMNEAFLD